MENNINQQKKIREQQQEIEALNDKVFESLALLQVAAEKYEEILTEYKNLLGSTEKMMEGYEKQIFQLSDRIQKDKKFIEQIMFLNDGLTKELEEKVWKKQKQEIAEIVKNTPMASLYSYKN